MDRFPWKEEYDTGERALDNQHREIFLIAELLFAARELDEKVMVRKEAFKALFRYFDKHFQAEEAFWEEIGSPELEAQRKAHAELVEELNAIWANETLAFRRARGDELEDWLENKLIRHITELDHQALAAAAKKPGGV